MNHLRSLRIGAALVAALILAAPALALPGSGEELAPDFTLEDLRGEVVTLSEVLADGPVILDFWATWCKPCNKALPKLQKLADKYEGRVQVITISIDDPRSRAKIAPTVRSMGVQLPVLLDGDKTVASLYRVASVPSTFLIAQDGRIAAVHSGYRDGEIRVLESELNQLLAEGKTQ
jgi:thiol-disulfide isomerase/thioredoxin